MCSAVARILQQERAKQGLALSVIATKAGLSRQMVSYVEQEQRNPTLDTLLRMCAALGVDFESVIRRAKAEARKCSGPAGYADLPAHPEEAPQKRRRI